MPANKNALIRYKTIDRCLRNRYRKWTLDDLVEACTDALYDMEGITKGYLREPFSQLDYEAFREFHGNRTHDHQSHKLALCQQS
jgi:hypothetical protein